MLQSGHGECALASLAMIADYHGHRAGLSALRARSRASGRGLTLANLILLADSLNLESRALRTSLSDLGQLRLPCILHWNLDHFVVLEQVKSGRACIVDPALGRHWLSNAEISVAYTGIALELNPGASFIKSPAPPRLRFRDLFATLTGVFGSFSQLLLLSAVLQFIALLIPLYSQLVIDEVIVASDRELLNLLVLAFLGLTVFNAMISVFRAWLSQAIGAQIRVAWLGGLLSHLLRLPFSWFSSRSVGDVQSRFNSMRKVEQLLTTSAVEALIDGLMASTTLVLIAIYAPQLSLLSLGFVAVYAVLKYAMYPSMKHRSQEAIIASAASESNFLESVRAVLSLKALSAESLRGASFRNRTIDAVNASLRVARLAILQNGASQLLFSSLHLIVIWLAARRIMDGELSVGVLVAYLAYQTQFVQRSAALVDRLLEFRLASVHLERVAEIANEPHEIGSGSPGTLPGPKSAPVALTAVGLWYRYSSMEPFILKNISFAVSPGEHVVLTGASGLGKTTLIKLLMGLVEPERGELRVDGRKLQNAGRARYRSEIGAVLQEDTLFGGSLLENIAGLQNPVDVERAMSSARCASIHEDIQNMPMQYETHVGDMGSALSGGQKQRLLLARALYREPRILFLDEATSHLDAASEQAIYAALRSRDVTIIAIAHRQESIRQADRVIRFSELTGAPLEVSV